MIDVLKSAAKGSYILKDRAIYKEFVRIPFKFEVIFIKINHTIFRLIFK